MVQIKVFSIEAQRDTGGMIIWIVLCNPDVLWIFSSPAPVELQVESDHRPKVWVCSRRGLQDNHLRGQSLKPNLYHSSAGF